MNSKQMTKALIEHELLWLIDNPDQDNVAILADWVMAITTGRLYDDDESLTKAYNQVFND